IKLKRLATLAKRAPVRVCVDDVDNIKAMGRAAQEAGSTIHVLVEGDVGMNRCGVPPGAQALALASNEARTPGLQFLGRQEYDGHHQRLADEEEKRARCLEGLEKLVASRRLIEQTGLAVDVVTGGGTGTWEYVAGFPGVTEIQPGSFVLMDAAYHTVRPE